MLFCELCCSAGYAWKTFCGRDAQSLPQFHASPMFFPRSLWTLWFRCCKAASGSFICIQQRMVEQFFRFACHVSPIKLHGPTWLPHSNRFCIALHIICELSTTFVCDCAWPLPISVWQLVCQPFFVPMVCACILYCQTCEKSTSRFQARFSFVLLTNGTTIDGARFGAFGTANHCRQFSTAVGEVDESPTGGESTKAVPTLANAEKRRRWLDGRGPQQTRGAHQIGGQFSATGDREGHVATLESCC